MVYSKKQSAFSAERKEIEEKASGRSTCRIHSNPRFSFRHSGEIGLWIRITIRSTGTNPFAANPLSHLYGNHTKRDYTIDSSSRESSIIVSGICTRARINVPETITRTKTGYSPSSFSASNQSFETHNSASSGIFAIEHIA